ncbi:MAG: 50S ribosomal protein L9 [Planctomycetota bacterium]|nr:MAG: 50S ribosomal protein L9 [Planctomycetota bacterium]
MQVLLRRNVEKLGRIGDIVEVKPGYARNYLLPQGIAVTATEANIKRLEREKTILLAHEEKKRQTWQAYADTLKTTELYVEMQATEEGRLYGSVSPAIIAEAASAEGIPLEAKMVLIDIPMRELGTYEVRFRLHFDVETTGKVLIVEKREGETLTPEAEKLTVAVGEEKEEKREEEAQEVKEAEEKSEVPPDTGETGKN